MVHSAYAAHSSTGRTDRLSIYQQGFESLMGHFWQRMNYFNVALVPASIKRGNWPRFHLGVKPVCLTGRGGFDSRLGRCQLS